MADYSYIVRPDEVPSLLLPRRITSVRVQKSRKLPRERSLAELETMMMQNLKRHR
jgi:hypothetical protein